METLSLCPVCSGNSFKPFLTCRDYTVSQKEFNIQECTTCSFRFTNPRPEENELGAYYKSEEYISHSNTNKGLVNKLYQTVRKYTLLKKLQLLFKFHSKKGTLLDVGCGTGEFLNTCKNAGWITLGIEPDQDARHFGKSNYQLDIRPENELAQLPENGFDVITLWHVLEHVPRLNEQIKELKTLLKDNGTLIIAVPNCSSKDAEVYGKYWAAYDVPRHLYHFTPETIQRLLSNHELKIIAILPMLFDSFYVSMLSEKYKSLKINYLKAFWNGFRSNLTAIKSGKKYSSQIYIIKKVRSSS